MEVELTSYKLEDTVSIKQGIRDMLSQGWHILTTYTVKEGISYIYFIWWRE